MFVRPFRPLIRRLTVAAAAAVAAASPAQAGIIHTTGQVAQVAPLDSVVSGAHPDNANVRVFAELLGHPLSQRLLVDASTPGSYVHPADYSPDFVSRGTRVDSYFFHADQSGGPGSPQPYSGSVTFGESILGVIFQGDSLDASDGLVGLSTTTYPAGVTLRGLEVDPVAFPNAPDSFTISADRRTVSFNLLTGVVTDQFRVITAAPPQSAPEPASVALFGLGLVGLAASARRRWGVVAPAC